MTRFCTLFFLLIPFLNSFAQTCDTKHAKSFYGNTAGGYMQAHIDNRDVNTSNQEVFMAYAWTDNSHGVPLFNGRTAFRFDISSIPTDAVILNATLNFFPDNNSMSGVNGKPTYGSNNTGLLQRIIKPWAPDSTTWNNPPVITVDNEKILEQSTSTSQTYAVDITDIAKLWASRPDSNFGMLLRMQTENNPYNSLIFLYNEASKQEVPRLDIRYAEPASNINELTIKGNNPKFQQLGINDNYPDKQDSLNEEIDVFTWTNNTNGFPYFNGREFLKYNLSSVPANATVESAKLYLYAKTNSTSGVAGEPTHGSNNAALLQKIVSDWTLANTTWNHQPLVSVNDQKTLPQSTNTAQNYVIDITDFAQEWINKPDSNFGMLLRMQTEYNPYNSLLFESKGVADSLLSKLKICYKVSSVLPLQLSYFQGSMTKEYANLWWATSNEVNAAKIVIEKSFNGSSFIPLSSVNAKGSLTTNSYEFKDNEVNSTKAKVYYRLKFVDKDGRFTYSNVLMLSSADRLANLQLSPNPAKDFVRLTFVAKSYEKSAIVIVNAAGKEVSRQMIQINNGINSIVFGDLTRLLTGVYFIRISIDGEIITKKLIIQ